MQQDVEMKAAAAPIEKPLSNSLKFFNEKKSKEGLAIISRSVCKKPIDKPQVLLVVSCRIGPK